MECPKCEATLNAVHAKAITVTSRTGSWRGISYVCPSCGSILSVGLDPLALKNDVLKELLQRLGKK